MIKLFFIRHSLTAGNEKKRYIGATDEPLSRAGRVLLLNMQAPGAELLFSSPLQRCIETAKMLYPNKEPIVIDSLRECDFGEFENRNAAELSANPNYQQWIDSNAALPFPGGESREDFLERSRQGFLEALYIIHEKKAQTAVFLVHGGTIMNLLSLYGRPKKDFYAWHVENGCGYETEISETLWTNGRLELNHIKKCGGNQK